jgi:site-specific recombinase XerD
LQQSQLNMASIVSISMDAEEAELLSRLKALRMKKQHDVKESQSKTSIVDIPTSNVDNNVSESTSDIGGMSDDTTDIHKENQPVSDITNFLVRVCPTSPEAKKDKDNEDSWMNVIEDFVEAVASSRETSKKYRKHIKNFENESKVDEPKLLKKVHFKTYFTSINERKLAINTTRSYLIPVKSFGRYLMNRYNMQYNPADMIKLEKKIQTKEITIEKEDIDTILDLSTGKKLEFIALLYFGALRLHEVCKMKYKDIKLVANEPQKQRIFTKKTYKHRNGTTYHAPTAEDCQESLEISIVGKGNRPRKVKIGARGTKYLRHLASVHEKLKEDYIFPSSSSKKSCMSTRTGCRWVQSTCKKLNIMVDEFTGRSKVTPHMFRHTAATNAFTAGADLMTVQEFLGHASVQTTEIYLHGDKKKHGSSFL